MDESPEQFVGWELAVPGSQTMTFQQWWQPSWWVAHLEVDEQFPQALWGHHHCRVQLCDVALVQSNVIVSGEALQ